jgi:hypothetical protein
VPVAGAIDPTTSVQYELGEDYIFVDGQCHFWAMAWGVSDPLGEWSAIHEGALDGNTERMLAVDSHYADWGTLTGRWGAVDSFDASTIVFHDTEHAIGCVSPCEKPGPGDDPARFAQVQQMYQNQQSWVQKLYQQGTSSTGPMRIAVFKQKDNAYPGVQRVAWPLSVPLDAVVDDVLNAGTGRSHLVDMVGDTASLRDLRGKLVNGQLGVKVGLIAIQNDQDPAAPYPLYARDAIPALEDAHGLIPLPPALP